MTSITHHVQSGDVTLAVYEWSRLVDFASRPETLILIHGYPDSAEVWRGVASRLAKRFHVVTYDVRGTGQSSIPAERRAYGFDRLTADLDAVIAAISPDRAVHLVGHDWGGLQGWEAVFSLELQGRIASYTAATPSLDHVGFWFKRRLQSRTLTGLRQFVQRAVGSSYMGLLNLPWLPELTWRLGLSHAWPRVVAGLEGVPIMADPAQRKNGVSGLGLYRQNLISPLLSPKPRHTELPVQLLLMARDPFVPESLFAGMEEWAPKAISSTVDAGHWGILSQPEVVAETITRFVVSLA